MSVFLKPPVQTYGDLIRIRFWSSNGWGLKFCIWKKLWSHADAAGLRITLSNEEPLRIFKIFLKNLSTVEYSWVQLINKVMLASNVWQRSLKEVGTSREGDAAITSLIHPFKETFSACYTHTHTHTHTQLVQQARFRWMFAFCPSFLNCTDSKIQLEGESRQGVERYSRPGSERPGMTQITIKMLFWFQKWFLLLNWLFQGRSELMIVFVFEINWNPCPLAWSLMYFVTWW